MSTQEITSKKDQYTLWQILGIWLAGGAPIWILAWLVYTMLAWKDRYWGVAFRVYYTLVMVAAVAFIWFLNYWNLLGWRY
jgi:hypothetical protein